MRNLQVIDFAAFESLNAEDGARQVLPPAGEVSAEPTEGEVLLSRCGLPPPASGRLPLQGEDLLSAPRPFALKGAILKSHGETIAGLERSLKDDAFASPRRGGPEGRP